MPESTAVPFDLVRIDIEGHPVLVVYGELDLMTSPRLHDAVTQILAERPRIVLIDLANVTFLDSTALGTLVVAQRHVADSGAELRLVAVAPQPAKIFEVTGLADRFNIFPDAQSATELQ
jgi:anti-sigma B factor antagonist